MSRDIPERTTVTLDDVAKAAGVSRATASRVLNGSDRTVSARSMSVVSAAAARLGYSANAAAQATARGRTRTVAYLVSGIPDDYASPISVGVFRAAEENGLFVTTLATGGDPVRAAQLVASFRGQRPQVILIAGSRTTTEAGFDRLVRELEIYQRDGGRVVFISQDGLPFDTTAVDNVGAGRAMAEAMYRLGYREFTIFAGNAHLLTAIDRTRGFIEGLSAHGIELPTERIIHSEFSRDGGYSAAGEFLGRQNETEIILSAADSIAIGALARFRESGVDVPGDIAITGIDDMSALRDISPALTTVHLPWVEIGERAFELALSADRHAPTVDYLSGHVVTRKSTPPRGERRGAV